jgi:REP element-mobilizing transposase RayT
MKQLALDQITNPRTNHGGHESRGKRKSSRPFSPKSSMHIVLKSARAKGLWSLKHRKNESKITSMVYVYAHRFDVHVYRFANVGNHIHLLVKASDRKALADYLRVLAGRIAVTVSGARKQTKRIGKFWDHLCWSRLVKWGKEFHFVQRYVFANELEAIDPKYRALVLKNPYLIPD